MGLRALWVQAKNGAPRAKPVVPCLTPMWGDIPVTRLHIPPRPEAVVSCGRDEVLGAKPLQNKHLNP